MFDFSAVFLLVLFGLQSYLVHTLRTPDVNDGLRERQSSTINTFVSNGSRANQDFVVEPAAGQLAKRRVSRHLNIEKYHEDFNRSPLMSLNSFVIEILPQSSFVPTLDGIIHIRFRVRMHDNQYGQPIFQLHTYSVPSNQILKRIPEGNGYIDTVFSMDISPARMFDYDTKIMIVVISNDFLIDTRLIKIRRDLEQLAGNGYDGGVDSSKVPNERPATSEITYSILNSCRNIWFRECNDATWSFEFSVVDKYGIMEITSNPYTISLSKDFFSGTTSKVHGYSVASCCLDRIELITLNVLDMNTSKIIYSSETNFPVTSIVMVILLTIFVIIVLVAAIAFVMYRRSQNRSSDLPVFSSSRNL